MTRWAGTQLNEHYAIRTFPLWDGDLFHGGTSCHLSTTWALAEASVLLGDKEGMDLVQEQLEWTLGQNPFGESFMYGVGYNFAPLFVYCTHNIVGALPVGIDSFSNDEPFWHGSAYATSKEIWIAPVNRFMGTVATFLSATPAKGVATAELTLDGDMATARILGSGSHSVALRCFNADTDFVPQGAVKSGAEFRFKISPIDSDKPFVAALIIDGEAARASMITGAAH